jgi:hypothetical protein
VCLAAAVTGVSAAETDCDSVYCFTAGDFSGEETLAGIFVTSLPDSHTGTILLGNRVLQPGDILTAQQLEQLTFTPVRTEENTTAALEYLPIYPSHVAPCTAMTIGIRGKEDQSPVAEDTAVETYKNLELRSKLKASDPENQPMTYTVIRQPKRGSVTIAPDGTFTYTPKKNKVGIDSFVYTATDPAGKVSREATVTVTILKPSDSAQYSDTQGTSCRFTAEWMKNSGIFQGETLDGNLCFSPDKDVTRGEFVTMLVKALELETEPEVNLTGYTDEIPQWLKPYLAAAVRSGLTANLPEQQTFGPQQPITGTEAAVMLCSALDLHTELLEEVSAVEENEIPLWASAACTALNQQGIFLNSETLTRGQAADILYTASKLAPKGMGVFTE